jgi:hypothetical protein
MVHVHRKQRVLIPNKPISTSRILEINCDLVVEDVGDSLEEKAEAEDAASQTRVSCTLMMGLILTDIYAHSDMPKLPPRRLSVPVSAWCPDLLQWYLPQMH